MRDMYEEHYPSGLTISYEYGHRSYYIGDTEYQYCEQCEELAPAEMLSDEGLCAECIDANAENDYCDETLCRDCIPEIGARCCREKEDGE
jgi:YgiT-type zinc finger domain-containing protein